MNQKKEKFLLLKLIKITRHLLKFAIPKIVLSKCIEILDTPLFRAVKLAPDGEEVINLGIQLL